MSNEIARLGDMGEGTRLDVLKQPDGDIIIGIIPKDCRFPETSVEFCTPGSGGGSSPKTWQALIDLMKAMKDDEADRPQGVTP